MRRSLAKEFLKGIFGENPTFRLVLGLCPTLAVSTTVINGLGMGTAATFVLLGSNIIISMIRNFIPEKIRIPCFIVIIATFVTIVELVMKAYLPILSKSLGIFVPLIVVNCIIMARAEAFASRHTVFRSILDGLGMGIGFTLALLLISSIREIAGSGTIAGLLVFKGLEPVLLFALAPGALLVIGILIGTLNFISKARKTEPHCVVR